MIDVLLGAWAAGETKTYNVNGSYFEILECAYPIDVKLLDRNGVVRSDMRQAEASFYSEGLDFATIQITSVVAQNIRSFYGDGTAGTRRTSGIVSVVDGGKARTIAKTAFLTGATQAATASNNSHVQLWNPGGSGKNLILDAFSFASTTSGVVYGGFLGASLATSVSIAADQSKSSNGILSVGFKCVQANVGLLMPVSFQSIVSANNQFVVNLKGPIIIGPGKGFVLATQNLNTDLVALFEFFEDPI